ncbi:hypothetical protein [Colwellia sp. E150_009]
MLIARELGGWLGAYFQKMHALGKKLPSIVEDGNFVKVFIHHSLADDPETVICKFANKFGSINNKQARDLTGIRNTSKISTIFSKLRDKNLLHKNEAYSSKSTTWSPIEKCI